MFDLDDTLFDHRTTSSATLRGLAAGYPTLRAAEPDLLEAEFHRLLEETWSVVLAGGMTPHQARVERFRRLFEWCGGSLDDEECESLAVQYRAAYQGNRVPVAGALALLERLHGRVVISIVTNNFVEEQREKMQHCGFDCLVSHLTTADEAGVSKPDVAIYRLALSKAECEPSEAVMVGDSWSADVLGAVAVGVRAVWFNRLGLARPKTAPEVAEIAALTPTEEVAALLLNAPIPDATAGR